MTGPVVPSDEDELRDRAVCAIARLPWDLWPEMAEVSRAAIRRDVAEFADELVAYVLADRERYAVQRAAEELRAAADSAHPWEAIGVSDLRARAAALTAREEAGR